MPVRETDNLSFETAHGDIFAPLRDHYIRVDDQATEEYLNEATITESESSIR